MANSIITKHVLANALKDLMEEKSFSKISVADICEKCGMDRKSFYYHFRDKYDLVNWIFDVEFIEVMLKKAPADNKDILTNLSFYFYENHSFYRKALSVTGQNSFSDHFRELCYNAIRSRLQEINGSENMTDFQINFFSDAILMAFQRWIMEKDCMKPEEFIAQINACEELIAAWHQEA